MLLVRQDVKSRHSRLTTFLYDISKTLQVNLCCPFQILEKMSMKAPSNNDLKLKENTIITMTQDQTPSCIFITPLTAAKQTTCCRLILITKVHLWKKGSSVCMPMVPSNSAQPILMVTKEQTDVLIPDTIQQTSRQGFKISRVFAFVRCTANMTISIGLAWQQILKIKSSHRSWSSGWHAIDKPEYLFHILPRLSL